MTTPSFTLSEFSALVSAALDSRGSGSESSVGGSFLSPKGDDTGKLEYKSNLTVPEPVLAEPRSLWFDSPLIKPAPVGQGWLSNVNDACNGRDGKRFKAGSPNGGGRKSGFSKKIRKQLSLTFNSRFDGRISSSKAKMLLVQPPGEGPFPPAVTVTPIQPRGPIPAASMSEVDLGGNCLYLGSGGACGKFAAQETGTTTSTLSPPPVVMLERVESSSPVRGIFSRIRRHLSMTNLISGTPTASPEDAEATVGGQELQSATTRAGAGARENTLMSGPVVAFASSPSFHSALPVPSTIDSTLESCPDTTSSVSTLSSLQRQSLCSSPSLYSRESADATSDLASYIGSSSSFFAAIARGPDGRKSRIGSEASGDACTDGGASEGSLRSRRGLRELGLSNESLINNLDERSASFRDILDCDTTEANTADCYMPYVPLIMQHERLQHQLRTRVSLDEVASLARSSLGSKRSVRSRATMSSLRESYTAPQTTTSSARPRKRVPPPLKASSSKLPRWNQESNTQPEPYSPTSTVSSRSPITPRTPLNFSVDAHSHTSEESTKQSGEEDYAFQKGVRMSTFAESNSHSFTNIHQTTTPDVNVHPPTPPIPSLQPAFVEEYTQSKSSIGVIDAIDQKSAMQAPPPSPTRSISRKYTVKAPPPMAPPPSGPLPLPPAASIAFEDARPMIEPSVKDTHIDSLPNAHHEWPTTHRAPPFINGSPTSTIGMRSAFKKLSQAEDVDVEPERFLTFTPADDSGVALIDNRLSLGSTQSGSVASSAFFSAQTHLSDLDTEDDDGSILHPSLIGSLGSDALSVLSSTSSEDTENAMVTANTRANAAVGRHISTRLIGVGRQQLESVKGTSGSSNVEWTLSLGSPSPRRVSKQKSAVNFAPNSLLRSDSVALPARPAVVDSDGDTSAATASIAARKRAGPSTDVKAPSPDFVSLRTRTQSESALGRRKPHGILAAAAAATPSRSGNDDWTLSMPLPFFPKSAKATASVPKMKARVEWRDDGPFTQAQKDVVVTVAGVDLYCKNYVHREFDQDEVPLVEDDEDDPAGVAPDVFTVPRVVSIGSGIERATRSKDDVKRISLLDDEAFGTEPGEGSNSNLAKLDVLSRDLEKFNDLLRHSKSLLQMRPGSSGSGTQSDSGSFSSSSVIGIFQGNQGRSEPLPPSRLQVCDEVTSSIVHPDIPSARPSISHLPASTTEISSDAIQGHVVGSIAQIHSSSLAPPALGSGGCRSSVISSSSASSSATVTPTKVHSLLPFASPPVVSNTQDPSSSVRKSGSSSPLSSSTPVVECGLEAGSAITQSLRESKSTGLSRSLRIDTNTTSLSVTPIADKDSLSGEITPKNASSVPEFPLSVPVEDEVLSSFLLEPLATPPDLRTAASAVKDPAPTDTATSGARNRRASCSSFTLRTCTNLSGSQSSLTSVECLTMGSSALLPPCPKPSTSGPTPPESLSSVGQASDTGAVLKNAPSKSKGTFDQGTGTNLETRLLPSRSSSVSSNLSSKSSVGSTRTVAPKLEYRIQQLRRLGVDASPLLISQTEPAQPVREPNALKTSSTAPEIDADSECSGPYYSARSSFSNDYTSQNISETCTEATL